MDSYEMSRKADALSYGFLASRTSSIITKFLEKKELNDEQNGILLKAKKFIEDSIEGQKLVSGDIDNLIPTTNSINAVGYALEAVFDLEESEDIEDDSDKIESIFIDFDKILYALVNKPTELKGNENISKLKKLKLFFFNVSKNSLIELGEEPISPLVNI